MATADDFYRWGKTEPLSTDNFDKRFLDLAYRLKPLEAVVISWQAALAQVDAQVLAQTETVISGLRDQLAAIVTLEWLTGTSSTSISLVEGAGRSLFVGDQDRALFAPGPFAIVQRSSDPTTYAVVKTVAYEATTGQFDFTVETVNGAPGPFSDWSVAALAGSTLAQMNLLAQGKSARDAAAASAKTASDAAAQTGLDRQAVHDDRTVAETAAGNAGGSATAADASAKAAAASASSIDTSNFLKKDGSTHSAGLQIFDAGLVLTPIAAPAAPVNGELWATVAGLFARIAGQTFQVASATDVAAKADKSALLSPAQIIALTIDPLGY